MFRKVRKTRIEKEEIIADFVFLLISFIITVIIIFFFDIHWNFYSWEQFLSPEKHVFTDKIVYIWGGLIGAIIGFFIIKLFLFGLKEEEIVWKNKKSK